MKRFFRRYVLFLLILLLGVLLDGVLSVYTRGAFITYEHQMVWQVTYVLLFAAMLVFPDRRYTLWAFSVGLIYDVYYSSILTYYTLPLIVTVYLFSSIVKMTSKKNFIIHFLLFCVMIFLVNSLQYGMAIIHQLNIVEPLVYATRKVVPTLLLNAVCFVFLYPIVKKIFLWIKDTNN